jgi:molybdopterin converting factor small subunit
MNISVEFAGLSRVLTGARQVSLDLEENGTFQDIVHILADKYPSLVGKVIQPDGQGLYPSNLFSLNGQRMVQENQMDQSPNEGDRVILMSILAGG